jgi:hypothetical protein
MRLRVEWSCLASTQSGAERANPPRARNLSWIRKLPFMRIKCMQLWLAVSSVLLGPHGAMGQPQNVQLRSAVTTTPHPAVAECHQRFRLAEIGAQIPHQAQTLIEFCATVATSCRQIGEKSIDCDKAVLQLDRQLASAVRSMSAASGSRR